MKRFTLLLLLLCSPTLTYGQKLVDGVQNVTATIVVAQQSGTATPGPWQLSDASQPQRHAGSIGGKSKFETVLVFDKSIKGQLIKTEGFGSVQVGNWWNQNNTAGDKTLKSVLCAHVHDFTVDGRAEFRPYPYSYNQSWSPPDVHGPDMPVRAHGLAMQGAGNCAEHLRFFNVPGTAIIMRPGTGDQAAFLGTWDATPTTADDIEINQAINGIDCNVGDSKLSRLWVSNVAHEGLTLDISGGYLSVDHVCGADIACHVLSELHARQCYHESARIGTLVDAGAHGCEFDSLNIGPGTCREAGLVLKSNGNTVRVFGGVGDQNKDHPSAVGVDCSGNGNRLTGNLTIQKGDVGAVLSGNAGTLDLRTFQPNGGTAIRTTKPINGWMIYLSVQGYNSPVALEAKALGTANTIHIVTMGEPVKIVGKIPAGNTVDIDGTPLATETMAK